MFRCYLEYSIMLLSAAVEEMRYESRFIRGAFFLPEVG